MLAFLLRCGLRRSEVIDLKPRRFQKGDDHWAITDFHGKVRPEKISVSQPDRVDMK
jgi:integrase